MPLPTLTAPPTIDASLAEYADVAPLALDRVAWGHRDGAADISGTARIAVAGASVVVAVEVRDDRYVPATGIAGDHVEVWLADAALDREDDEAGRLAELLRRKPSPLDPPFEPARFQDFRAVVPRMAQLIATPSGLTDGALFPVPGEAAYRATESGWVAELRIPLTNLPRLASLTVDDLRLRVDILDADGAAAQDALVNDVGNRSEVPLRHLVAPLVLGADPWRALQAGPVEWFAEGGTWVAYSLVQEVFRRGYWLAELPVGRTLAKAPVVVEVATPSPARRVDEWLQWLDHGVWRDAPGVLVAQQADGDAWWVVFVGVSPWRGAHGVVPGELADWWLGHWTADGLQIGDGPSCGTFGADPIPTGAALDGLDLLCNGRRQRFDFDSLSFRQDR